MILSILDNDLYKFTMQQAVLGQYPEAYATYEFTSRKNTIFDDKFLDAFCRELNRWFHKENYYFSPFDVEYMRSLNLFNRSYLSYLQAFQADLSQIKATVNNGKLNLKISGPWVETILWEVPLMALISHVYFNVSDINWDMQGQVEKINKKGKILQDNDCKFADFGTRRRRNYTVQKLIVSELKKYHNFIGTSNVHLAKILDVPPIGTFAHEWIMGISALESLRHANRFAMQKWNEVYQGKLGIALTDTYGSDAFFQDFDDNLSRIYDGVRHDSGSPYEFTNKTVSHYLSKKIDPSTKKIVFSDGLEVTEDTAELKHPVSIKNYCKNLNINPIFGIGTNLTNDFDNSPALNMVIKLRSIRENKNSKEIQLVKLSDVPTKATGDPKAIEVANWTFGD